MCSKMMHRTSDEAISHIRRLQRNGGVRLKHYRCTDGCKFSDGKIAIHVGHRAGKRNKRGRNRVSSY